MTLCLKCDTALIITIEIKDFSDKSWSICRYKRDDRDNE